MKNLKKGDLVSYGKNKDTSSNPSVTKKKKKKKEQHLAQFLEQTAKQKLLHKTARQCSKRKHFECRKTGYFGPLAYLPRSHLTCNRHIVTHCTPRQNFVTNLCNNAFPHKNRTWSYFWLTKLKRREIRSSSTYPFLLFLPSSLKSEGIERRWEAETRRNGMSTFTIATKKQGSASRR